MAWDKHDTARILTYCDQNTTYKVIKHDMKYQDLQTLSLEVGKAKTFIINSTYREHTGSASGLSSLESKKE